MKRGQSGYTRSATLKKVISLVLLLSMVLTMVSGCGSRGGSNTAQEASGSGTETGKDSGGAKETTKIKWAVWDIALTTYYQPLIDAYKVKNPDVEIEMVDLGSQDYMTALSTQLAGNDTDLDVVLVKDIPGYSNLVSKNVLEPVDTAGMDLSAYSGVTEQILVNDKLYALPFRSDFWILFYNKDIFDAAGASYPSNDMTLEQYDQLARAVTKTDLGNEVYGSHYHTWRSTIQLLGVLDGKNSIVDGNYDFLKPYYEMVLAEQKDGVCQDYATLKTSNLHYSAAFAKGNVAMLNMGSWFIPTLIDKIKTGEFSDIKNWGLAKYPHPEGVEAGTTLGTITSIAVASASKNKEISADFAKFVSGTEGAEVIAKTGTFPAIKTDAVLAAISGLEGFPSDAESKEALKTVKTYLEMPLNVKSAEIDTVLNDGHDYIMTETKTIDEGIAYMNEEVSKLLQ